VLQVQVMVSMVVTVAMWLGEEATLVMVVPVLLVGAKHCKTHPFGLMHSHTKLICDHLNFKITNSP